VTIPKGKRYKRGKRVSEKRRFQRCHRRRFSSGSSLTASPFPPTSKKGQNLGRKRTHRYGLGNWDPHVWTKLTVGRNTNQCEHRSNQKRGEQPVLEGGGTREEKCSLENLHTVSAASRKRGRDSKKKKLRSVKGEEEAQRGIFGKEENPKEGRGAVKRDNKMESERLQGKGLISRLKRGQMNH